MTMALGFRFVKISIWDNYHSLHLAIAVLKCISLNSEFKYFCLLLFIRFCSWNKVCEYYILLNHFFFLQLNCLTTEITSLSLDNMYIRFNVFKTIVGWYLCYTCSLILTFLQTFNNSCFVDISCNEHKTWAQFLCHLKCFIFLIL